jgi:acetolactate synthase small subunit
VDAFIEMLRPLGINDITRSGYIAINRVSNEESSQETVVSSQ